MAGTHLLRRRRSRVYRKRLHGRRRLRTPQGLRPAGVRRHHATQRTGSRHDPHAVLLRDRLRLHRRHHVQSPAPHAGHRNGRERPRHFRQHRHDKRLQDEQSYVKDHACQKAEASLRPFLFALSLTSASVAQISPT